MKDALAKEDGVASAAATIARHLERPRETFWRAPHEPTRGA